MTNKVLAIDDMPSMLKMLSNICKDIGLECVTKERAKEAWELLKNGESFDLILCDQNIPEMSGTEFLMVIKDDPQLKNIPFIFVTAIGDKDNIIEALSMGATNYIIKPFEDNEIKQKIKEAIE